MNFIHYLNDIDDERDLISETLCSLESSFKYKSADELQHHNRTDALAYMCLRSLREYGISLRKKDIKP